MVGILINADMFNGIDAYVKEFFILCEIVNGNRMHAYSMTGVYWDKLNG